ncbi:MAG TPA: hypothetical protein VGB85_01415, partial [Nannocystis sp.]
MRSLIMLVAGSVAIVTVVAVLLRSDAGQTASSDASASQRGSQQPLGLRGANIDSARRGATDEDSPSSMVSPGAGLAEEAAVAGKRERPEPEPPAPPIPPSATAVAEGEASLAAQPQVLAAVEQALSDQRSAIRRDCWNGTLPSSASFPVTASYGADGTMLALSVGDDRGAPSVGSCVRSRP